MKIISTLITFFVFSLTIQSAHSATSIDHALHFKKEKGDKGKKLSFGSNRVSGDIQLYFTAEKEGEAIITILNQSGKIVLQQTTPVANNSNTIPLKNVSGLPEGPYTVSLVSNNKTYSTGLLIWK